MSENPTHGTLAREICDPIDVSFDSTGLAPGEYLGGIQINTNDPREPMITVPVTLTVIAPDIEISPSSLEMTLATNETDTLAFSINNIGTDDLSWSLSDLTGWLGEDPTSGTTQVGGSSEVVVTFDATGMALGENTTIITITSNDPDEPLVTLPVTLIVKNYPFYLPVIARH